jgi:hypothetical protein
MVLKQLMEGISKAATVISVLIKLYTIACHERGHINVMLALQSCTDCLQVMAGSCTGTFPAPSDGAYGVGNVKVEQDMDMKEERELYVKTENVTSSEEEECLDIKDEGEEVEKIVIREEKDVELQGEVS